MGQLISFFLRHIRFGYRKKHWHTLLLLHWEGAIAARTDEKCYHIEASVWVFPTKSVATIFQIKAKIALPFQSRLTTEVVQWQQWKPAKKCTVRSEFLFCLLSRFCRCRGCVKLLVALTRKTLLDMRRFRLKNRRFDGKHPTKSTFAGTHIEVLIMRGMCDSTDFGQCLTGYGESLNQFVLSPNIFCL